MRPNFNYIEEKAGTVLKRHSAFQPGFDVKKLTKDLQIDLQSEYLGDEVAGFIVMTDDKTVITVNKQNPLTRRRFTIAHEIGHYILHKKDQPIFIDKAPRMMYRNAASSTGEDFKEKEANAFAAALLMPKELIEEELINAPSDISDAISFLAQKFRVSENAMSFRLSNLGYGI